MRKAASRVFGTIVYYSLDLLGEGADGWMVEEGRPGGGEGDICYI